MLCSVLCSVHIEMHFGRNLHPFDENKQNVAAESSNAILVRKTPNQASGIKRVLSCQFSVAIIPSSKTHIWTGRDNANIYAAAVAVKSKV